MLESNVMYIQDENGKEKEMQILFTFENDDNGKKYVVFTDPTIEDSDYFAYAYDDEQLIAIETEEEWQMIEEVIGAFEDDAEALK